MKDRKAVQSASRLKTKTVMSLNRHQQRSSSADMFHLRNEIDREKRICNEALNHSYSFIFTVQVLYIRHFFLSLWLKKLVTAATATSDFSKWNLFLNKGWLWIGPTELTKLYTRKYCASLQNSWREAYLLHSNISWHFNFLKIHTVVQNILLSSKSHWWWKLGWNNTIQQGPIKGPIKGLTFC